ncbi:amidase [Pseudooceanicola sediminis]|uniref:Amidase n=1 Tax=Pseudooceanicola sediminis TaxID=2211117 RepID=A0A399IYN3_9RHOB|nr:amidase [Pseudooceanicola sediminis]KAA2314997.1 amidase [Puniceibacterium sp. HSS470]RII37369.1 amidase [Pseudooceanicola sediminis]|tara:strand:+ start:53470 stop:54789 length:1320 start_codon:yes stop_codon:yes gene_type:complete
MSDLVDLPYRTQRARLEAGTAQIGDIWRATQDRIARRDGRLGAVVSLAQGGPDTSAGLPIGIKDIIDVDGFPTRCGSHAHDAAGGEADAVTALRRAGLTPMAKLATYEYALTGPAYDQPNPPARNPWNPDHITGGSSSGSAAAVAGGLFRAALGSDTGGSIRAPAAYCGIVGLKPTHGLVPVAGCFPLSPSLDVIGPLAACVEDAALVLEALAPESRATVDLTAGVAGLRIAYARDWFADDPACDPAVVTAMDDTAALLSMLGARIELITLPAYAPLEAAGTVILQAEAWEVHRDRLRENWDRYGVDARRNLITGAVLTGAHLRRARAVAQGFRRQIDRYLGLHAAILTPTTLSPAPKFSDFDDGPVWTAMRTLPFNMSGHPAISVPCGFADNGLPLGAQLVARPQGEATLCRIAQAIESHSAHTARPAIEAEPISLPE